MRRYRSASEHQRIGIGARLRSQRQPAKIQDAEHARVVELVLKRKPDNVEFAERPGALERKERQAATAQLGLHVEPRRKHALAGNARGSAEQPVQNLRPEVGHANLVGVGKREADACPHRRRIDESLAVFAAGVARGLLHLGQKSGVRMVVRQASHWRKCSPASATAPPRTTSRPA